MSIKSFGVDDVAAGVVDIDHAVGLHSLGKSRGGRRKSVDGEIERRIELHNRAFGESAVLKAVCPDCRGHELLKGIVPSRHCDLVVDFAGEKLMPHGETGYNRDTGGSTRSVKVNAFAILDIKIAGLPNAASIGGIDHAGAGLPLAVGSPTSSPHVPDEIARPVDQCQVGIGSGVGRGRVWNRDVVAEARAVAPIFFPWSPTSGMVPRF